ncbi:MAG: alpha-glucosidase [Actinomycetota bacterium]|nr:alpha-glucosidase [Actinomycetota bacterium]
MTDAITLTAGAGLAESAAWWASAVVYQIYPRSFADSNGDGIGDLRGILNHVDHLVDLGIDVVWLSPIYASPGDDNGYDISDYQSIDPAFGTLEDLDVLTEELHRRGIKLVMDLVVNHTSDEHPWFVESSFAVDSPKRDWYWWRPPRPGFHAGAPGAEPTNWESFFSGSAWALDVTSEEYYLHLFSRKQPDLNWENPQVRAAVYEMMRWWLDRGVDGFRMDVINLISKDVSLPDGQVDPGRRWGDGFPFYASGPRIHEFLQEMHREVFGDREGEYLTVGEMPGVTVEDARLFTDPLRRELDMVFQFEHVGLDHGPSGKFDPRLLSLRELKESFLRWQNGLSDVGWNSLYWNNHDQPRAVSRFGNDAEHWRHSAKLLAAVLHLQRGTPFIFQGEELGMTNADFATIGDIRDIESLNFFDEATLTGRVEEEVALEGIRHSGRDNARTPMQWTADRHAGFTSGKPWIAANTNAHRVNASDQRADPDSIFAFYRALIRLRHSDPVVVHGDFTMLAVEDPQLFAYQRRFDGTAILVLASFGDGLIEPRSLVGGDQVEAEWAEATLILGNYESPSGGALAPLRPWEVRVLRVGSRAREDCIPGTVEG